VEHPIPRNTPVLGNVSVDPSNIKMLALKRASKSRPDGQWSADDYQVFDGE
jgi:hypothetical protein